MPFVIPRRARSALLRIATLTPVLVLCGAGAAFASCPTQPLDTPFSQWNDPNSYFLVPGGSFEGSVGWSLNNATVTAGNEPFQVGGSSDSQALTIQGGGSATSPYFCVDDTMSAMRFFAQQVASGSDLQVDALVYRRSGVIDVPLADLVDGTMASWGPSDPIDGGGQTLTGSRTLWVALQFSVPSSAGGWQIDDIYVDPYRSG